MTIERRRLSGDVGDVGEHHQYEVIAIDILGVLQAAKNPLRLSEIGHFGCHGLVVPAVRGVREIFSAIVDSPEAAAAVA